jgi:thiol-disulfide isomerase/thioredoxin
MSNLIKSREFELEKETQDLTFVLFEDPWCGSCRDVEYILKELRALKLPVYVINIAKNPDLIEKYSIEDIPTVIIFRKGRIIGFLAGKQHRNKYLSYL